MKTNNGVFSKTVKPVYVVICFLISTAFFSSCEKEVSYPELTRTGIKLEHFKPGSWWKYDWYEIDGPTGNTTSMNVSDTVFVKEDSIINGNSYLHLSGSYFSGSPYLLLMRDSLGFLVNEKGSIVFSARDQVDTVKVSTVADYTAYSITRLEHSSLTFAFGTLENALERQTHYYKSDGSTWACGTHRVMSQFFHEDVGILYERTAFFSQLEADCSTIERRLSDYHLAP